MTNHLSDEIKQQPDIIRRLLQEEWGNIQRIAEVIRQRNPQYMVMAARGSSDNAARYGKYLFGTMNRLQVALSTPSLFTLYNTPPRMEGSLVLAVSQSGQSPDIVAVIAEGRKQGSLTIALTNEPDSPLANAAEYTIRLHAEKERAVAATKTYTASLMVLAILSAALCGDDERYQELQGVPKLMEQVLAFSQDTLRAAERYRYMEACVVNSRGYNYATAYEIALKLKELTYILAEPYSSADFQHGPVALVEQGFPVIAIVPEGHLADELITFLDGLRGRGAELVVISALEQALGLAQTPLPLPAGIPEWLSPMVAVIQGQLFALGLTLAKGFNPDQPRGIGKVTLTR
jgi:glucosamine--fructose-6-phosphate aminotransferase (isomerizing)